jgi:hypothetical protein
VRLSDIDAAALAQSAHDALLGQLWRPAMLVGIPQLPRPEITPSEAYLAVYQLAHYATTGTPPEHRLELVHEYQISVAEIQAWLPEGAEHQALETVLLASAAREGLAAGRPLTGNALAVLASVSPGRLSQLVSAGDAPRPRQGKRDGREQLYSARSCCEWLTGRGVVGL